MMNRARQEGRQNLFSVYSNVSVSMLLPVNVAIFLIVEYHIIIIGFLINMQVQGHHPHQWAPFKVTG